MASPMMVDGYVRVSRVGQRAGERFISPGVQNEQIVAWAKTRPAVILQVWEELDESGADRDRPLLELAVQRIEQGLSQGLVVASVDRFGRSLLHGLTLIERIERAGGGFFAVRDGLDVTTDTGRLVLRIMLAMAEWQLDRIRSSWEIATNRAVARGVYVGGQVPVGYRRLRSGRLRPDPAVGPIITELFQRRVAGESLPTLSKFLEAQGVPTVFGNPGWLPETVRRTLAKRVYVGEVSYGHSLTLRAHQALIDEASWQGAQHPRVAAPSKTRTAPLAGLVRCASCGMKMHRRRSRRDREHYSCNRHSAAGSCPSPAYISARPLEACVEEVVLDLLARRRRRPESEQRDAQEALVRAQNALSSYRDSDRVLMALGDSAYSAGLAVRAERVRRAGLAAVAARTRRELHDLPPTSEIEDAWPDMSAAERREITARTIDCVFVQPGQRRYDERIWICPTGKAPQGLPRRGDKRNELRLYRPRREWVSARYTGEPRRWSDARLERELRAFVSGRKRWPTRESFQRAGRGRLHHQMRLQSGEKYWAGRLGLPRRSELNRLPPDEEVRRQLTEYLRGRTEWPTGAEFIADGRSGLRHAVTGTGGVRRWAAEFALPRRAPRANGPIMYWTEDRIRKQLAALCRDRSTFPSAAECTRAGLAGMRCAIARDRGVRAWAREFRLPLQNGGEARTLTARSGGS